MGKRTDKLKIKDRRFDKHTDGQVNVKWSNETNGQTDRLTDRQMDRQTQIHM